jgi:hypothetical protein
MMMNSLDYHRPVKVVVLVSEEHPRQVSIPKDIEKKFSSKAKVENICFDGQINPILLDLIEREANREVEVLDSNFEFSYRILNLIVYNIDCFHILEST